MQPFYIQRQAKNKGNRCASVAGAQEFSRGSTGVIRYGTGTPKRGKRLPRGSSQNPGQGVVRGEGQCPPSNGGMTGVGTLAPRGGCWRELVSRVPPGEIEQAIGRGLPGCMVDPCRAASELTNQSRRRIGWDSKASQWLSWTRTGICMRWQERP